MEIDESNFNELVIEKSKKKPILVDFWAPWCGPCLFLGKVLKEIKEEMKNKIEIVKVDIDKNQNLAEEYGIMSIPNVKLFKDGKIVDEFLGARTKDFVKNWIEERI